MSLRTELYKAIKNAYPDTLNIKILKEIILSMGCSIYYGKKQLYKLRIEHPEIYSIKDNKGRIIAYGYKKIK